MPVDTDTLYISAPVNALVEGIFQADTTVAQLRRHGDFALGTFNHLDGEMIMVNGQTYQVTGQGEVHTVADEVCSPFAIVTAFRELSRDELPNGFGSIEELFVKLRELLPSPNVMYALWIDARFTFVRTRSVPRQESYRPLVEVTRDQPTFERREIQGSLIGFFTPEFLCSLNVPGFHLHALSADRTFGGHLLQCRAEHAVVRVQILRHLSMDLPASLAYLTLDFSRDTAGDLAKAETERTPSAPHPTGGATAPPKTTIRLRNHLDDLATLVAWLETDVAALDVPPSLVMTLNLVLEEWIVNVISYAYTDTLEHTIELRLWRTATELRIEIEDDGRPFDPTAQADVDTTLPIEQRKIGGLGIHFIRKTMDHFAYRRENGRNLVTVAKTIPPEST